MSRAKQSQGLNIAKILDDFNRIEKEAKRHNGTFKIESPFDKALDSILKVKPSPSKKRHRKS